MKKLMFLAMYACAGLAAVAIGACGDDVAPASEVCTNGTDDDGDTLVDCADSDCTADPTCAADVEDCDNTTDDDGDGDIDCADADCTADPACTAAEVCDNTTDDDGDGAIDCADSDCAADPACVVNDCGNGAIDVGEDCDGTMLGGATCVTEGFFGGTLACTAACAYNTAGCTLPPPEDCANGVDDDGDGAIDCADSECTASPSCSVNCGNGTIDAGEDCDGLDLGGATCASQGFTGGTLACTGCLFDTAACTNPEACNNGVDDDLDGLVDCADTDCAADPICTSTGEVVCDDYNDDDMDMLTDCNDPTDCQALAVCTPGTDPTGAACAAHTECSATANDPACLPSAFGFPGGYCSEWCDGSMGSCGADAGCFDLGLPTGEALCLDLCVTDADCRSEYTCTAAGMVSVCYPGNEICDDLIDNDNDMLVDCADPSCVNDPACEVCGDGVVTGGEQCDPPGGTCGVDCRLIPEICDNGIDDNTDGLVDCADPTCSAFPACLAPLCVGIPVATLGDNAGDTTGGTTAFEGDPAVGCLTAAPTPEALYTFTPASNGTLTLTLTSATDQGVYVRTICADQTSQLGCADQFAGGTNEVLSIPVVGGVPLTIIVDTYLAASEAGPFTLNLTLVVSICGNGTVDAGEQCDDSNTVSGDGCSATCQTEFGAACMAATTLTVGTIMGDNTGGAAGFTYSCQGMVGAGTDIYNYVPTATGTLTVTLTSDADLGIFTRTVCDDAMTETGCADVAFGPAGVETLAIPVTSGVPVSVFIGGWQPAEQGPYTLTAAFM